MSLQLRCHLKVPVSCLCSFLACDEQWDLHLFLSYTAFILKRHRQYAVTGVWFVYENLPSLFVKQQTAHNSNIHKSSVLFVFIGLQVPSASTLQWDYHEITSWVPLLPAGSGPTQRATGKKSHFSSKMQTFFRMSSNAKKEENIFVEIGRLLHFQSLLL